MSSMWGNKVKISIFGESHSSGIGVVLDGIEAGVNIDMDKVLEMMARRAPGKDKASTKRLEKDFPKVMCGIKNGKTTGAPITAVIENTDTRSNDYSEFSRCPRPGHADYTAFVKYKANNDFAGGGHFSGRLTAPLVFAGAICKQVLEQKGIKVFAHINSVGDVYDTSFENAVINDELINKLNSSFAVIDEQKGVQMRELIEDARLSLDSIGGTVECMITGVDAGFGSPMFDGAENIISSLIFGIPAVKGIEFGKGFELSQMRGSQSNDSFLFDENKNVVTKTNNCGGILGGITNGMPIYFKVALKPTPSIAREQDTVDLVDKCNTKINIKGRHDPCIVQRAVAAVESAAAVAICELLYRG